MKRCYRYAISIIAVVIALTITVPVQAAAAFVANTEISSRGAVVIDYDTGIILYAHNENTQRVPASMMKVLAAYVVYDAIEAGEIGFNTSAAISKSTSEFSYNRTYSNAPLPEGSSFTIRQLMEIVLVCSACAATIAMGERLCGSEKEFIERMKEKATRLGVDTEVYDCWGGSPGNRISPLGIATVTRSFIMEHPEVLEITAKRNVTFNGATYNSSNLLLGQYVGIDGFKTGYTDPAGYCFTGTAKQGGRRLISVTMGSTLSSRYPDTRALLNYGFTVADQVIADYYSRYYARPSTANLILDGVSMPLYAYMLNGSHYFRLRDLAYLLNGTVKQFQVDWNGEDNSISLTGGIPYTADGSELSFPVEGARPYHLSPTALFFDGVEYEFEIYRIDNYSYFKLRDLVDPMGFGVEWISETRTVVINTNFEYAAAA